MLLDSPALALTQDILLGIFYLLQSTSVAHSVGNAGRKLPIAFILSHVTQQWRALAINAPLLWANILVTTSLCPDALRVIISRSAYCELDITFLSSPPFVGYSQRRRLKESLHLRDSASLLIPYTTRWRRLRIVADANSMRYIMNPVTNISLPRLRLLELKLVPTTTHNHAPDISHFGPFRFNPHVFTTLNLHQVAIYPAHPCHFSGLNSLQITQTCIIDQFYVASNCMIPISTDTPCMSHLAHLTISSPFPSLPSAISFTPRNLSTVTLCHFRCTTHVQSTTLMKLFSVLVTPCLEELVLEDIDGGAWDVFLDFLGAGQSIVNLIPVMRKNGTEYPALKRLTLKSLGLNGIDKRFATALPNIEYLALVDLDPTPVMALFQHDIIDRFLWRQLKILINEVEIENPRQTMLIGK